jgi:WD repeat-containing protein 19
LSSAAPSEQALIKSCKAGIARCTIRAGDARGGLQLALASGSKATIRDCADLLAADGNLGSALEAGELYEAAGDTERAVALYLEAKAFSHAAPLMGSVKNRKLVLEASFNLNFFGFAERRHQSRRSSYFAQ